ncbi:phage tail tape measure protein [uncultured Robinsoniella sp.]|uniref:phage tail tape measure protein n=1 Tax=uncultured Robinsoniella sp. TaxID=904190 RepID=UPI00205F28E8|nr:MAG TPA: minor tail protein [Caudoviricetes sp.]
MAEDFILRVRGELDLSSAERQWSTFISSKDKTSFVVKADLDFGNTLKEVDQIKSKIAKEFEGALGIDSKTAKRYANAQYNESRKEHKKYIADVNKAENEVAANKRKQLQIATREESARRKKEEAVESRWQKNLYNQEQAQAKQVAKIKENDLKQTRKADATDRHRQVQQQVAEMKANAYSKNAHNNSLVESGKSNIAKWTSEYKDRAKQIAKIQSDFQDGKFLSKSSSMSKSLRPYSNQETELLKQARQYEKIYNNASSNIQRHFNPEDSFKLNDKALIANFNNLEDSAKRFGNTMKAVSNDSSGFISTFEATTASNKTLTWLNNNTKAAKKYGDALKQLAEQQRNNTDKSIAGDLQKQVNDIKAKASLEGLTGNGFFGEIGRGFKAISQFVGVYGILQRVVSTVGQMGTEVIKVDDAITQLRMSTGASAGDASKMMKTYSEMGKELKATGVDVATSATEWLKQGKTIKESNALAKDSIVLSKIGDLSSEDSTKYLTSAMKGYDVAVEDTSNIIDKLSAVDLVSATDVGGLATGMSEVAANADLAGISMDKLLGYLAVIGETTQQGMSSVGTSLNAVFSRMGNIKLSRLKDYQNDDGEDLSNVETVLKGEGLSLRNAEGEFRNFGDVLDETANKWDSFSSVSQRAVASAFAGTHHMNDFIILMQNYGTAMDYSKESANSSGQALEKFSSYQDSLTGKLEGFENSFQNISSSVLDSDFLKSGLDMGSGFLDFLDSIIDKIGILTPLLAGAGLGVGISKFVKNFDQPQIHRLSQFSDISEWVYYGGEYVIMAA